MSLHPKELFCLIGQLGNGGTERQLYLFLKHLDREKYCPSVLVSTFSENSVWEKRLTDELSVPVTHLGNIPVILKILNFLRLLLKHRPDIIFSWSFYTNAYRFVCPEKVYFIGSLRGNLDAMKRQLGALNFKLSLQCRRIVVNSNLPKEQLKNHGIVESQISLIRNILEPDADFNCEVRRNELMREIRAKYKIPEEVVVVAGMGRNAPEKDIPFFLDVFRESLKSIGNLHGLLIGNFGDAIKYELRKRNLEEKFTLTGNVETGRRLLPAADIFFLSSKSEGMPNSLLEAIDAGCAVLATDTGGVRDIFEGFDSETAEKILIAERDTGEASFKLNFLALNKNFRKKLVETGKKNLSRFSAEKIMPEYYKILSPDVPVKLG